MSRFLVNNFCKYCSKFEQNPSGLFQQLLQQSSYDNFYILMVVLYYGITFLARINRNEIRANLFDLKDIEEAAWLGGQGVRFEIWISQIQVPL